MSIPATKREKIPGNEFTAKRFFQGIIRRIGSMGLARKFYLLYFFILVVPIILTAVLIARNLSDTAIAKAREQGQLDIHTAEGTVEKNITNCWHAIQLAQSNKQFINVLSDRRPFSTLELVQFQKNVLSNIDAIKSINSDIDKFAIYIDNDYLYEFYPTIHFESDVKDTSWYQELISSANGLTYQISCGECENGTDVFTLCRELSSQSNEHIGVIQVQMKNDVFFGPLYSGAADKSQCLCILGENGILQYNPNNKLAVKYLSNSPNAADVLLSNVKKTNRNFVTSLNNHMVVVNWAYISEMDSYLLNITSMEPVNQEIREIITPIIAGCLLILGFLSFATYIVVSVLTRKLHTVIGLMRNVGHGDFAADIPDLGGDEVGELNNHFKSMLNKINELILTGYKKQIAAREAEIKSLHSQLNAHFIYNVLESIKMMAVIKYEYEISESITSLGRIMRYSMNWHNQCVSLRDEINNLTSYVKLMNLQREIPVELVIRIPEELYEHEVLKMSLQPLVENAMLHGLKQKKDGGRLEVAARADGPGLLISVYDNGCGIPCERLREINAILEQARDDGAIPGSGSGIGLINICQRIRLFYGEQYGVTADSAFGESTCITLRFPYQESASTATEA